MGITPDNLTFLLAMRSRGVSLERTMTLGRQGIFHTPVDRVVAILSSFGERVSASEAADLVRPYGRYEGTSAEPLLSRLGANEIRSIDASRFEGCTDVHDLNRPIPLGLEERFSAVLDLGTLEHVWNYPVALLNSMRMVEPEGHLVVTAPTNNFPGHGLYQLSPEIFFRAFSPTNGFEMRMICIREGLRRARWYEVQDPAVLGRRLTFVNSVPTMLYVCARRTTGELPTELAIYQSDYSAKWERAEAPDVGLSSRASPSPAGFRRSAAEWVPRRLKDAWDDRVQARLNAVRGLGADPAGMRPVNLEPPGN